jgi:predicted DNA repair protein MutK
LEQVGFDWPSHTIHQIALNISQIVPEINGTVQWSITAMIDGILGLVLGFVLIPVGEKIITPFWRFITGAGN